MDLPKEIRLIVYEHLPRTISHRLVPIGAGRAAPEWEPGWRLNTREVERRDYSFNGITLIMRSVNTSILRVSKSVNEEAKPIIYQAIENFILGKAPKLAFGAWTDNMDALEVLTGLMAREFNRMRLGVEPNKGVKDLRERISKYKEQDGLNLNESVLETPHMDYITPGWAQLRDNPSGILLFVMKSARQLLYHYLQEPQDKPIIEYAFFYEAPKENEQPQFEPRERVIHALQMLYSGITEYRDACVQFGVRQELVGCRTKGVLRDVVRDSVPECCRLEADIMGPRSGAPLFIGKGLSKGEWNEEWVES